MSYIKAILNDKIFQHLIDAKVDIQIKEMGDQNWYPEEIEEINKKIRERGDWLRANCTEHQTNKVDA
jgi:hypothetical protein